MSVISEPAFAAYLEPAQTGIFHLLGAKHSNIESDQTLVLVENVSTEKFSSTSQMENFCFHQRAEVGLSESHENDQPLNPGSSAIP